MEETDLLHKMNASNAGALGIGPVIVQLPVVEVGVQGHSLHVLGLEGLLTVWTTLVDIVIDILMTIMMDDMVIEIILTVETKDMAAMVATLVTGTHLLEIAMQEIVGMVALIVTHKMVLAKTGDMIGMVVSVGSMMGMEMEDLDGMTGPTGVDQDLMTGPAEEGALFSLTAINCGQVPYVATCRDRKSVV